MLERLSMEKAFIQQIQMQMHQQSQPNIALHQAQAILAATAQSNMHELSIDPSFHQQSMISQRSQHINMM